jgi:hypothetical protein
MNNGTAYSTLAAFKTIVSPRDAASISEVPVFLALWEQMLHLHVNGATKSQIESGGTNISGYTNDFDGDIRQGILAIAVWL